MYPLEEQLKAQIEFSPFSEEFTVIPAGDGSPFTIRGIFDESTMIDEAKKSSRLVTRIMLYEVPEYKSGETQVIVRGKVYKAQKHEMDANNGCLLFLI